MNTRRHVGLFIRVYVDDSSAFDQFSRSLSLFLRRLSFSFTNIAASIFVQVFFPLLLLLLLIDRYVTLSSIDQDTFLMLVALLKTEAKRQGEARR